MALAGWPAQRCRPRSSASELLRCYRTHDTSAARPGLFPSRDARGIASRSRRRRQSQPPRSACCECSMRARQHESADAFAPACGWSVPHHGSRQSTPTISAWDATYRGSVDWVPRPDVVGRSIVAIRARRRHTEASSFGRHLIGAQHAIRMPPRIGEWNTLDVLMKSCNGRASLIRVRTLPGRPRFICVHPNLPVGREQQVSKLRLFALVIPARNKCHHDRETCWCV